MAKDISLEKRIMEAAIEVIAEKGYYGSRTSEIAKVAKCSEGSIFRYYKNKEELLRSIVHQGSLIFVNESFIAKTESFFENIDDLAPKVLLRELIRDRLELIEENRKLLKIVFIELNFHDSLKNEYVEIIKERLFSYGNRLLDVIGKKIELKDIPREDMFSFIFGSALSIVVRILLSGEKTESEDMVDSILDMVIDGISYREKEC